MASWRPRVALIALAVFYYFVLDGGTPLFQADDYFHLRAIAQNTGGSSWSHWQAWLGRVPLWAVMQWIFFCESKAVFAIGVFCFFLCHLSAIYLLAIWLYPKISSDPWPSHLPLSVCAALFGVLGFAAADSEILLWPTCMPYTAGALLMALSLRQKYFWPRVFLMSAASLTYETFLLPGLFLLCLEKRSKQTALWSWLGLVTSVLCVVGATRTALAHHFGAFHHLLQPTWATIGKRLPEAVRYISGADRPEGIALVMALAVCLMLIRPNKLRVTSSVLCLAALVTASAPSWLLAYPARRAVYGSRVCFLAWSLCLFVAAWESRQKRRWVVAGLVVMMGFVVAQAAHLRLQRQRQREVVTLLQKELETTLDACAASPCSVSYGPLNRQLPRSWVLPPFCWEAFLENTMLRHRRGIHATFVLDPSATGMHLRATPPDRTHAMPMDFSAPG